MAVLLWHFYTTCATFRHLQDTEMHKLQGRSWYWRGVRRHPHIVSVGGGGYCATKSETAPLPNPFGVKIYYAREWVAPIFLVWSRAWSCVSRLSFMFWFLSTFMADPLMWCQKKVWYPKCGHGGHCLASNMRFRTWPLVMFPGKGTLPVRTRQKKTIPISITLLPPIPDDDPNGSETAGPTVWPVSQPVTMCVLEGWKHAHTHMANYPQVFHQSIAFWDSVVCLIGPQDGESKCDNRSLKPGTHACFKKHCNMERCQTDYCDQHRANVTCCAKHLEDLQCILTSPSSGWRWEITWVMRLEIACLCGQHIRRVVFVECSGVYPLGHSYSFPPLYPFMPLHATSTSILYSLTVDSL